MNESKSSLKDIVAAYLRSNPELLKEYPDVLQTLSLSHSTGAPSSLIERQVKQLREQNPDLTRQLNRLMHLASENEQLMTRLHQLTLELMAIGQLSVFFKRLASSLREDFNADIVKIFLFSHELASEGGSEVLWVSEADENVQLFQSQLEAGKSVCGRFNDRKLSFLFESKCQWVKSSVLVPIGQAGKVGLLAIGSSDPSRFYPGMGTLFLDLLADVISSNLTNFQPQEQRLSA